MLNRIEALSRDQDDIGRCLSRMLIQRALLEIYLARAEQAGSAVRHARYQLSLRHMADKPAARKRCDEAHELLRRSLESVGQAAAGLKSAMAELDELTFVMKARDAVAELAVLLDDNRQRLQAAALKTADWQTLLLK